MTGLSFFLFRSLLGFQRIVLPTCRTSRITPGVCLFAALFSTALESYELRRGRYERVYAMLARTPRIYVNDLSIPGSGLSGSISYSRFT